METIPAIREGPVERYSANGDLWSVVLAAGAGSRFGGDKLAAAWGEAALLQGALAAAKQAPVAGVIAVVQPGGSLDDAGVQWVEARDWQCGMAASLRAGIAALPPTSAGAFVFLGDMPRVPVAVLAPLAAAVRAGAPAAAPEFEGRLGHPVLFSASLFTELSALTGDKGGKAVLDRLGPRLARIASPDDGVLFDVDHPSDLIRPRSSL